MAEGWPCFDDTFASNSHTCKRKRTNLKSFTSNGDSSDHSVWVDKYRSKSFDDLGVHKKKISEVEAWISHCTSIKKGKVPILLMNGPAGSGKTATLMVAAASHHLTVCEWANPLSISFTVSKDAGLQYASLTSQFEEFLFRSGRYPTLTFQDVADKSVHAIPNEKKLLLIEDLPHHLIREPTCFRDVLKEYRLHQRYPLVIILSDGSIPDSVKKNLLPPDILNQLQIQTIRFNPVVTTIMSKVLTKIATKEKHKVPKDMLNLIISSASGDIRAAINSLQFHLQKGAAISLAPVQRPSKSKMSKRRKSVDITDSVTPIAGKDISLVLFRALGKILYCKRKEPEQRVPPLPDHLQKFYRDPLVLEPENILEHCCLSGSSYSLFLHHNSIPFFNKTDDLSSVLDYLSTADVVSTRRSAADFSSESSKYLDLYEGSLAARCVAFFNSERATSKLCNEATGMWRPLHKPSWYQVNRKLQENEASSHRLFWKLNMPSRELLLNLLPYINMILSSQNNNRVKRGNNLSLEFDRSQKDFLATVIYLPKWKSFASATNDRIVETELGDDLENMQESAKVTSLPVAVDGKDVTNMQSDQYEDFNIEEFSD